MTLATAHETQSGETARKGYHHGALREALLSAARRLLAEKGVAGFTLADASRLAGVSGAAPYRHFRDKDELVAEVAREGFAAFAERLRMAAEHAAHEGGVNAFKAMGRAYLGFARTEPGAYAAMFSGHSRPGNSTPDGAGERAFATLMGGLEAAMERRAPEGVDILQLAFQIWALSHGVAMLDRDRTASGFDAEAALLDGVEKLLAPYLTHRA